MDELKCLWDLSTPHDGKVECNKMFNDQINVPICEKHLKEHKDIEFILLDEREILKEAKTEKECREVFLDRITHYVMRLSSEQWVEEVKRIQDEREEKLQEKIDSMTAEERELSLKARYRCR